MLITGQTHLLFSCAIHHLKCIAWVIHVHRKQVHTLYNNRVNILWQSGSPSGHLCTMLEFVVCISYGARVAIWGLRYLEFIPVFFNWFSTSCCQGSAETDRNYLGQNLPPVLCGCSLDHCMGFPEQHKHMRKVSLQEKVWKTLAYKPGVKR